MRENSKIVVLGDNSVLMREIVRKFSSHYETHFFDREALENLPAGRFQTFIAIYKPDAVISGLALSNKKVPVDNYLKMSSSIQNSLVGTDSCFFELLPLFFTQEDFLIVQNLYSSLVQSCFIRLGLTHEATSQNIITKFLESARNRKRLSVEIGFKVSLLAERKAAPLLLNFVNKCFVNRNIKGWYELCEGGTPIASEVLSLAFRTAAKVRPEEFSAKLSVRENRVSKPYPVLNCAPFQLDSEMVFDDWRDGVIETASGFALKQP